MSKLKTKIFIVFVGCQIFSGSCCTAFAGTIRVAVLDDEASFNLRIKGPYELIDAGSGMIIGQGQNLNTTVAVYGQGILLGESRTRAKSVLIKTDESLPAIINGRKFKGNLQLFKKDNGRVLVTNIINLEDYIKGILYHEASHYWPQEALKAQAIACRSYAVSQAQANISKNYDVTSDTYSQVYGGMTSERLRTNTAVEETKDLVVTYKGKVVPAYFHATCGGHSEDASMLWNIDIPPLKGVVCGFCRESPHYSWHFVITKSELAEKLNAAGYNITGNIVAVLVKGRDASGRITDLIITTLSGEITISAKDFRNISGPNNIRSANFQVAISGKDLVFEGLGWGHGVGLCQWGAYFMAKQGSSFQEILQFYYPQSSISSLP